MTRSVHTVRAMEVDLETKLRALPWMMGALIATSCVHEAGHAWVAWRLGDRREDIRRKTTPFTFRHISVVFTIIVPAVMLLWLGFMLGGAKPVLVRRAIGAPAMGLVALAGPVGNVFFGLLSIGLVAGLLHFDLLVANPTGRVDPHYFAALHGVALSFILALLNLIPLPPFDGSRIVMVFLPERLRRYYEMLTIPVLIVFVVASFAAVSAYPEEMMRFTSAVLRRVHDSILAVRDWIE